MSKSLKNFITIEVSAVDNLSCQQKTDSAFVSIKTGSTADMERKTASSGLHDANLEQQDGPDRWHTDRDGEPGGDLQRELAGRKLRLAGWVADVTGLVLSRTSSER